MIALAASAVASMLVAGAACGGGADDCLAPGFCQTNNPGGACYCAPVTNVPPDSSPPEESNPPLLPPDAHWDATLRPDARDGALDSDEARVTGG